MFDEKKRASERPVAAESLCAAWRDRPFDVIMQARRYKAPLLTNVKKRISRVIR
jgi:hypothetical protein